MAHRHLEIYVCSYILQTCCFQTWISLWQEDILFGGWPKMRKNGQFHKLYARDLVSQMRVLLRYHLYSFENMPYIGNTSRFSYFVIYLSMDDQDMWESSLCSCIACPHLSFNFCAHHYSSSPKWHHLLFLPPPWTTPWKCPQVRKINLSSIYHQLINLVSTDYW